jgi:cbb3-type cytochrome oxidase subunit 3
MKSEVLSQFPYAWLALIPLVLFFAVFCGVIVWVFLRANRRIYNRAEMLPLEEEPL